MKVTDFIMYGVAVGLNRAGTLLILPVVGYFVDVNEFGQLSLYITLSSIIAILLSFNISSIIAREIYVDLKLVTTLVYLCNLFLIFFIGVFLLLLSIKKFDVEVFLFGFFVSEAILLVNSTYLRYRLGSKDYLLLSIVRALSILSLMSCFVFFWRAFDWVISVLLIITLSNYMIFLFYFKVKEDFTSSIKRGWINCFKVLKKKYFFFALFLIPHSAAQWIISGADRFFVKYMLGNYELGVYSFSYSLVSFLLLVSSAFSLGFTQFCIKDKERYSSDKFYYFIFAFCSVTIICFLWFSNLLLHFFPNYNTVDVKDIIYYVALGIYFLFFYLYFSAAIFHDRNVKLISNITLFVSFVTLIVLYPFVLFFGVVGAAYVTMLSYFLYMVLAAGNSFLNVGFRLFLPILFVSLILFLKVFQSINLGF